MMLNYSCGLAQDFAGQSTRRQARRHVAHSSLGKQNSSVFFFFPLRLPPNLLNSQNSRSKTR